MTKKENFKNVPFSVKPSLAQACRQGFQTPHVVGIGACQDIVVENGCGDEGIIIGVLTHSVFAVDKEPFDP